MKHTDIKELFLNSQNYVDKNVVVCGWIRTVRESKTISFVEINDGTSFKNLQLIIEKEKDIDIKKLTIGSSLIVKGFFIVSEKNDFELNVNSIEILGECSSDYPLQKKRHTLEFLREMPHLRVRTRYFQAVFTIRDVLAQAIHKFFNSNGYRYIHAPIITASDCEGAGEMFRITTQPWQTNYKTDEEYYKEDFFGKKAGLSVSCQLEGEMAMMGLGKIYTFGPTFRAEHSNTTKHLAEFWHVEPEVAFADINDIIEIGEDFIKSIITDCLNKCKEEIEFLDKFSEPGLINKLHNVVDNDFARVTYTEAIDILKKSNKNFNFKVEWGCDLQTEHERYLTDEYFKKPLFVVDYPADIKSFYMKQNDDGKTVAATDLLVPGIGEIIGCSEREYDTNKLINAMKKRNMNLDLYKEYLDTRRFGTVPHSGFGLGFDRLLMYIAGVQNIRDTIMFPRTVGKI